MLFGGGILMPVRDDITCKLISVHTSTTDGSKLRKNKIYFQPSDRYWQEPRFVVNYDNVLLLGDFNAEVENNFLKEFCNLYGMKSLIRVPTCYGNPANPTCIYWSDAGKF